VSSVKVKFSNSFEAKRNRIERLPVMGQNMILGGIKRDCNDIINAFKNGIRENSFGLEPLNENTISQKKGKGFSKPETPLYGKGDDRKRDTYINMLRIKKLNNGYKIYPSNGKHWKSKLKLSDLFKVHEYGAVITTAKAVIKIPPRPALLLAYRKQLSEMKKRKKETSREVKRAMTEYINSGNRRIADIYIDYYKRVLEAEKE